MKNASAFLIANSNRSLPNMRRLAVMPWRMTRPAAIQLIGPSVVLAAICAGEVSAISLSQWPTSEILWRANIEWFHAIQKSSSIFYAYPRSFLGAWLVVFAFGLWGLISNRPLPLAISTNLSFLYAVFLFCGAYLINRSWWTHAFTPSSDTQFGICVILVALSFLSAAVSHIHYIRAIGSGS